MGIFARKLSSEARRFAQKAVGNSARTFGRKITHVAQHRGDQVNSIASNLANHADVAGLSGVSGQLRRIAHGAGEVSSIGRLLDENKPRAAVDKFLSLAGKNY